MGLRAFTREHGFSTKRAVYLLAIVAYMAAMVVLIDPDDDMVGAKTMLLRYAKVGLNIAVAFLFDKLLFGYGFASSRQRLFRMVSMSDSDGGLASAVALVARMLAFVAILWAVTVGYAQAQDVRTYVPEKCAQNAQSFLRAEQRRLWPDHPEPEALPALVEQESCVSLRSSRCCDTKAQFKTEREEGASILQVTRVWRKDGTQRFDTLAELRGKHPTELAGWSWANVYQRADLANRALVLLARDNYQYFLRLVPDRGRALDFADGGYNAGPGAIQQQRVACRMMRECDPGRWFAHAERACEATAVIPGTRRTACDIRRDHVRMVRQIRAAKYRSLMT